MEDQNNNEETPPSRRGFLKFALVGGIGLGVGAYLTIRQHPLFKNGYTPANNSDDKTAVLLPVGRETSPAPQPASAWNPKPKSSVKWESLEPGKRWAAITDEHPAGKTLRDLFPAEGSSPLRGVRDTGLSRADYLPLITGNAAFFRGCQNADGAIIDPFEKRECQYATPAFALAAATAVVEGGRSDLLEPATRAFTFALNAVANKTAADNHGDFYTPMLVHAYRLLKDKVPAAVAEGWKKVFESIVPEKVYRNANGGGNWNIVNICGEFLRRKDGLVAPDQITQQEAYVNRCVTQQIRSRALTPFGMYVDANAPLAYDAFPRLWLEDMMANEGYQGEHFDELLGFLTRGGLSTLLLLSPTGEWASGGRSAQHQWNEAQVAMVCEANARRWKRWGRPELAGAFKRAARLALGSVQRWQRPSGELWIVKNNAEPAKRFGYESYSYHSQYNLLAAAILALAYQHADDTIEEAPTPSERGTYVFDVRDVFHKVCAASEGSYALVDTSADSHYDSTGLLRFHRMGTPYSPYSTNSPAHRSYGPREDTQNTAMTPGIVWKDAADSAWRSLASFERAGKESGGNVVGAAELAQITAKDGKAAFTVRYDLGGNGARPVEETYAVSESGVEVTTKLGKGAAAPNATRVLFPALVSDGATDTKMALQGSKATVSHKGTDLTWEVVSPKGAQLKLEGPRVPTHNGYVQALVADLPAGTTAVTWRLAEKKNS